MTRYMGICADGPYKGSCMSSSLNLLMVYVPRLTDWRAVVEDGPLAEVRADDDYVEYRLHKIVHGRPHVRNVTNWWVYGDIEKLDLDNLPSKLDRVPGDFVGYWPDHILRTPGCSERRCEDKEVEWVRKRDRYMCRYHRDYLNNLDARVEKVRKSIGPEFAATFTRTTA